MKNGRLRLQVLETAKRGFKEGLVAATSGNYSIFAAKDQIMAITATSLSYDSMQEEDIIILDLSGKILEGRGKPSSEWRMHAEIYRQCPSVNAIVHTHSPYATALAVLHRPLPVVLIETAISLGGTVPVAEFELPGTKELGSSAAAKIKEGPACLLANHGVVAVGVDIEQAYTRAVYVEDAAKIYHLAKTIGEPLEISGDNIMKIVPKDFNN